MTRRKILIVEDEVLVRCGLRSMVNWEKLGLDVIGDASNGKEALEIYEKEKPDIVMTDIKMPVMDGLELIEKIREQDQSTRIVLLTCYEEFSYLMRAMKLGVSDYILKLKMKPDEIEKAMEIYKANDCIVISDEIWSDLTLDGHQHVPTQSVSEDARHRTLAFYAPSKTFNLAGLVGSYHIVYDSYLRDRLQSKSSKAVYNETNVLSVHALIGAYRAEGYQWVDELRQVLSENVRFACETIWSQFEGIEVSRPQGTYMLFLDCEKWCLAHGKTMDELLKAGWDVGVGWQDGRPFHGTWSIRVNLALPFSRVEEAFRRLKEYVF